MNNLNITQIIEKVTTKYGKERKALIPVLHAIVKEKRYLNDEDIIEVAKYFNLSSAEVYGVASFYSFLDLEPRGKYVIRVCKTISCKLNDSDNIIKAIKNFLNIELGQTTNDGLFTLLTTNCLGWCHKGPAMLINENVYTELTPNKAIEILKEYINKK